MRIRRILLDCGTHILAHANNIVVNSMISAVLPRVFNKLQFRAEPPNDLSLETCDRYDALRQLAFDGKLPQLLQAWHICPRVRIFIRIVELVAEHSQLHEGRRSNGPSVPVPVTSSDSGFGFKLAKSKRFPAVCFGGSFDFLENVRLRYHVHGSKRRLILIPNPILIPSAPNTFPQTPQHPSFFTTAAEN